MFGDVAFAQAPFASLGGNTYDVSVTEAGSGAEHSDSIFFAGGAILEAAQAHADAAVQANFLVAQAEFAVAFGAADTINNIFNAAVEDYASASEETTATAAIVVTVQEAVFAAEEHQAVADFVASIAEAAATSAAVNGGRGFSVAVAEAASASGAAGVTVAFAGSVSEAAAALAELSVARTANAYVVGVQLYVSIGGALVWAVVYDSQNANWQNVDNAQSSGWTDVNNAQTPGWDALPS